MAFVTGEPGIGKTAVVDEFLRHTVADLPEVRAVRGQCIEGYAGKEPYYPVLEALGRLCSGPEGDAAVKVLASRAPTWLVQFPILVWSEQRETLQREILGATRQRMLREIVLSRAYQLAAATKDHAPPPEAFAAASYWPMILAIQLGSPVRSRQSVPAATQAATSLSP